jgi:transposase
VSPAQILERSYGTLKRRLIEGDFHAGQRLEAARLAEQMNVSITPVRDVLNRLTGEGLVQAIAGGGFYVPLPDESTLRDLLDWNAFLAFHAARSQKAVPPPPYLMPRNKAERSAFFFNRLADGIGNREFAQAVHSVNDKLHAMRLLDDRILGDTEDELDALDAGLLIGYCLGIRSERRLCEEVHLNLPYRWFCRLGLDGAVPDHSTFSKNRHGRFRDSDLLRDLFEMTVTRCIAEGLVGGEGFAVDASLIKADANRQRGVPGEEGLPSDTGNHAAREYLEVLDAAAFGAASPVTPKYLSPADPAAGWTSAHGGQAFFAYSTNYLIDLENAVIVDVEATTAIRPAEVTAQRTMIDRTQERFGIWPRRLAADTG